jgi:DNA-binding NarL/FixJ family response regulator
VIAQVPAHESGANTCRVAIIDDQPITRAGMERIVADEPRFTVSASVSSVDEIDALEGPNGYDVAIIAVTPRGTRSSTDMITSVAKVAHPVVTSTWDSQNTLSDAIRAGAHGCVTRHSEQDEMLTALRIAAAGGLYICADLVDQLRREMGRPGRDESACLAPREIETVRWIAMGFTQSQIATRMGLSQATVNTYAKRIRSKLQVNNKAELTRKAITLGYLDDDHRDVAA